MTGIGDSLYCNWLSQQEGIPEAQWCYEVSENELRLKPHYLSLLGYRFPTEAEIEYAARAGAMTTWCFGQSEDLLAEYAWYNKNSNELTWPVGSLEPNDLGLFDVHGNVWTWCQERYLGYPIGTELAEDDEDILEVDDAAGRVMRGGSFCSSIECRLRQSWRRSAAHSELHLRPPPSENVTEVSLRTTIP